MKLALFDLDHTLIPFDSGMAWTRFMAARGALPADAEATYIAYAERYAEGKLDIHAMHRAHIGPLSRISRHVLQQYMREFEGVMAPRLPAPMQALVASHRDAGDLCAIVTATTRLISEPFAHLFGVPNLIATEPEQINGIYTGRIVGEPCFRELKVNRVTGWLRERGDERYQAVADFEASVFYSDSSNDLPLLEAVTEPVAVTPDARLRELAIGRGWRVIDGG